MQAVSSQRIEIELRGKVPSKKDNYRPRKGGGKGFFIDRELQTELDRLAMQIPGEVRDLRLEHPRIDFYFTYVRADWDLDNAATTLLDLLVEYGVIKNDNIARLNGGQHIWPAVHGEYPSVKIVLTPASKNLLWEP